MFASKFVKEVKEQMGAEVFILVGYLDEKGKIQKAKWVLTHPVAHPISQKAAQPNMNLSLFCTSADVGRDLAKSVSADYPYIESGQRFCICT